MARRFPFRLDAVIGVGAARLFAATCVASTLAQVAGPGCATYDIEREEPCRQAGYSIAARTYACTGDGALANARYERFSAEYRCAVTNVSADSFVCSNALGDRACTQVLADGDDLAAWLVTAEGCATILVGADGTALPSPAPAPSALRESAPAAGTTAFGVGAR